MPSPDRRTLAFITLLLALSWLGTQAPAHQKVYEKDFDFVCETVAKDSAAILRHKVDWKEVVKRYRPRLDQLEDDAGFIKLMAEVLAECRDSHTGLLRYDIGEAKIPSKWDGLWSAGLWIVEDEGRFHLAGRDGKGKIELGACLAMIGDWPVHLAMEREVRRCSKILGISSRHSFFASIGNRFVPMGAAANVELSFIVDGKLVNETVRRWGPSGRGFDSFVVTVPDGLKRAEGAVAIMLPDQGKNEIGYIRITGSMDARTVAAFHQAFDGLKEAKAMILDCRGMGGGSDDCAWEIAGRFFAKSIDNGRNGRIAPSGTWQFDGPVVMIQDSLEVSSAETFTWAMSETERAISIGRPTGGWSIIPRRYSAPSGKFDFRIGVTDRATPIRGLRTEGTGWHPDVLVNLGPGLLARSRGQLELAIMMARCAVEVLDVGKTRALFASIVAGASKETARDAANLERELPGFKEYRRLLEDDLEAIIATERNLLELVDPPDCLGAAHRLEQMRESNRSRPASRALKALEADLKKLSAEAKAQQALFDALDRDFSWSASERKKFLAKHGRTRYGSFADKQLPARE